MENLKRKRGKFTMDL